MTESLARAQAAQLAAEQGRKASIHHRELLLRPQAERTMESMNGYVFVLSCDNQVTIDSPLGVYDKISDNVSEVQHKHAGQITLSNYADQVKSVEILQITLEG